MLAGTQSVFKAEVIDELLINRLAEKDIDITAPMWGSGELMTSGEPLIFEQQIADEHPEFSSGLPRFGLKQERRRIRLAISDAELIVVDREKDDKHIVNLSFFLPAGCYATTVLRELLNYQDMTERNIAS